MKTGARMSTNRKQRSLLRQEKGASMVEFAIVLPLLMMLVFGIIEFALILYDKAVITNASREGARFAAMWQPTPKSQTDIQTVVQNYYQDRLISLGTTDLPVTTIVQNQPQGAIGEFSRIQVVYRYNFIVFPRLVTSITGPIDLSAETIMREEQ